MSGPSLRTENLTINFGGHAAVNDVTASFVPGELTVILVDDSHQAGRPVFDVGDDVALRLAVDQVRVLAG